MNIPATIKAHAAPNDRPVLLWLFERYHMQSEWHFVANVEHQPIKQDGRTVDYRIVYSPTAAGRALYAAPLMLAALEQADNIARNILTDSQLDMRTECGRTVRQFFADTRSAIAAVTAYGEPPK